MMTIQEIQTRKEDRTFDCKSIQIDPKALAIPIVVFAVPCTDKNENENRILLMHIPASSSLHTNQADEAFMRVGDKSRKLTFDERLQLMYDKGERSFEDTAVYGATIEDIDMDAVARYVSLLGYSKSPLTYLRENNHFVTTNKSGEEVVSVACMLLFGKNPQLFFPRARTRFIRYKGVDEKVGTEMNVIKDVTFEGTILHQIEKTVEYLETQVAEHTFLGQAGKFITRRDYPKFVIQEMVVNACCHRAYNIRGTEIQIKMFDNRIVFESPGKLPGMVRPSNIRHTHFSRNPKIAAFLKAYNYVKEYGEGVDRMCRELEVNGTIAPVFHTDDFILKVTVTKVTEKLPENKDTLPEKLPENNDTLPKKLPENCPIIDRIIRKANSNGEKLKENKIAILRLIVEDPYISKTDIANTLGISYTAVGSNIKAMRDKYLRRVGPDNGGFWEIIE